MPKPPSSCKCRKAGQPTLPVHIPPPNSPLFRTDGGVQERASPMVNRKRVLPVQLPGHIIFELLLLFMVCPSCYTRIIVRRSFFPGWMGCWMKMKSTLRNMASHSSGIQSIEQCSMLTMNSSHMVDLSEEPKEENIELTKKYFKRAVPMKQWLEMEIGITGGEEDGDHPSPTA